MEYSKKLAASIDELKTIDWQLFFLGAYLNGIYDRNLEGLEFLQSARQLTCTHGISYHHTAYEKILSDIPSTHAGVRKWLKKEAGIDQYLGYWNNFPESYLANPNLVTQSALHQAEDAESLNLYF